jgi:hypothetical protein
VTQQRRLVTRHSGHCCSTRVRCRMVSLMRGRCLTLCSAIPLEPPLLFCRARGQRAVRLAGVPHAVRMIAVFVSTAELYRRAGAGDRPATMMLAQVEETNRIGDDFPGQIDGLGRCR